MKNCILSGNSAQGAGGGAHVALLTGCTLFGNTANDGGGVAEGTLNNCMLYGNSASNTGGGMSGATLNNCTLIDNSATSGGGTYEGILNNCIVYYNSAIIGANYCGGTWAHSCTTPLTGGGGNFSDAPSLAGMNNPHLLQNSPCIAAGNPALVESAVDIDGEARVHGIQVDVGCDQRWPSALTNALNLTVNMPYGTTVATGFKLPFELKCTGTPSVNEWWFTGTESSTNTGRATYAFSITGDFEVVVSSSNLAEATAATVTVHVVSIEKATRYVTTNGNDAADGSSWTEAKCCIQDAVDAARSLCAGAQVMVSNGVYDAGGALLPEHSSSNRVCITNALTLRSVNGPESTTIVGGDKVRVLYLGYDAMASGFTLTEGHAYGQGHAHWVQSGGGTLMMMSGVLTNCILKNNTSLFGGGAAGGILLNCSLTNNTAYIDGGGTYQSVLYSCKISSNKAKRGGGAYDGVLNDCILNANVATDSSGGGGGAWRSTLNHCALNGNFASLGSGGGANHGTLNQCTLTGNWTMYGSGGGACHGTLNQCTLTGNWSTRGSGGGVADSTLNSCTLCKNSAFHGGGAVEATLINCILYSNSAYYSGGARNATLYNCTVSDNKAREKGGGACFSSLYNSIIWNNQAKNGSDIYDCMVFNSCASDGVTNHVNGCITNDPQFAGEGIHPYHLKDISPCLNAGDNQYVPTNTCPYDYSDNLRIMFDVVDMGAYEQQWLISTNSGLFYESNVVSITYGLPLGNGVDITNVVVGTESTPEILAQGTNWIECIFPPNTQGAKDVLIQSITGGNSLLKEAYTYLPVGHLVAVSPSAGSLLGGDIVILSGQHICNGSIADIVEVSLAGVAATVKQVHGSTMVAVCAGKSANKTPPGSVVLVSKTCGTVILSNAFQYVQYYYVDATSGDDANTGTTWGSAKKSIQAAVDLTVDTDVVMVSNGVYNTGGRVSPGAALTNRLCISNAITVRSVNGPTKTIIKGSPDPCSGSCGPGAVRGVYMTNACTLKGFLITGGFTDDRLGFYCDRSGGGAKLSKDSVLCQCVLSENTAHSEGGGVRGGNLFQCLLFKNISLFNGGGSTAATLNNCMLIQNTADFGGGGAHGGTLNNCVVYNNSALNLRSKGGGTCFGNVNNCIVWSNRAQQTGLDIAHSLVRYSCASDGVTNGLHGCITNDPQFVDGPAGNYRLFETSPCFNAGANAYAPTNQCAHDLSGLPRVMFDEVDMGCYEIQLLMSTNTGLFVGGNTVTISNGLPIGNGTDITNVVVGSVATAMVLDQGTNWITLIMPTNTQGVKDVFVQSESLGVTLLEDLYTYYPAGPLNTIRPASGVPAGGFHIVLAGINLCDGDVADVTSVTLAGVTATVQQVCGSTQIVVKAGASNVENLRGDVVIVSSSYGIITKPSAFRYTDAKFCFSWLQLLLESECQRSNKSSEYEN